MEQTAAGVCVEDGNLWDHEYLGSNFDFPFRVIGAILSLDDPFPVPIQYYNKSGQD